MNLLIDDRSVAGLQVLVDRSRIGRVLTNLLNNALRHTPAGGAVIISAVSDRDHVSITVSDNGDGMTPEQLGAFERFLPSGLRPHARPHRLGHRPDDQPGHHQRHGGSLTAASSGPDQRKHTLTINLPTHSGTPDRRVGCLGGEQKTHNVTFGHRSRNSAARYCCNSHATLQSSLHLNCRHGGL